ncbi:MAG: argininosuccinate synthase, partial [Candidatus Caldarchaeum sp.]
IGFEDGVPVSLDGRRMSLVDIIKNLNQVGGSHGYGVVDHVEDRVVGLKSREVYEHPAALILINAHIDLEKMFLGRRMQAFKQVVDAAWADMVYGGLWADPLRRALDAFIDSSQQGVSGEVRVRLFKGTMRITGRRGEKPLYSREHITYARESVFDQKAGEGFSKLWSLETRLNSLREKQ